MNIPMYLLIMLGVMTFIALLAAAAYLIPIFASAAGLKKAGRRIGRIMQADGGKEADLIRIPDISKSKYLNSLWSEYTQALSSAKDSKTINTEDYFCVDRIIYGRPTFFKAEHIPAMLVCFGIAASVVLLILKGTAELSMLKENLYPAIAGVVLGLIFILIHRFAIFSIERATRRFSSEVNSYTNGGKKRDTDLLSDILFAIQSQNGTQETAYEKMIEKTSERFAENVIPVLQEIENKVQMFISAATERQAECMTNLADAFVASLNSSFAAQLGSIEGVLAHMAEVQKMTSDSFEQMREISRSSAQSLVDLQRSEEMLFARFNGYLEKLSALSDVLTANIGSITKAVEYMNESSKTQTETIRKLSEFQQELSSISGMYTKTMETAVEDIKDQYSSSMISMRAVSGDMLKAGDHLRSAYSEFSSSLVIDIERVLQQFDEHLAGIATLLSNSIADLGQAVDELPEFLNSIRNSTDGGGSR